MNGVWCASEAEAERYRQLLRMEMNGIIGNLRTQVSFPLVVNNHKITVYRADFCYDVLGEREDVIRSVVEDVKGMVTPEFTLKHKLFDALIHPHLSVLYLKGKAKHPDRMDQPSSGAGWLHKHWIDRIPD